MLRSALELTYSQVGDLRDYAAVPGAFETRVVFDVVPEAEDYALVERALAAPLRKDYDAIESPLKWPQLFDVSKWIMVSAFAAGRRVGGAIGAIDTPGVDMLEARRDLVVLWDLRVAPEARNGGVGAALFEAVEQWGRSRACTELKVETQNVNVHACRLYRGQGCSLARASAGAYPDFPGEIQLVWRKRIDARR